MFDDSGVVAAIIAATVSLIVSAVSGFYTVVQNRKRFEILRNEILAKYSTESFVKAKENYLDSFRKFENALVAINERNPHDGTEAVQFSIDFYGEMARDFYLRNKSFLQTTELNNLFNSISESIKSGNLNDPNNHSGKRDFGTSIIKFCKKLNEQALAVN